MARRSALQSSPESELLLCCARRELSPAEHDRVLRLLGTELDWPNLFTLASRHGLRPLLYKHLSEHAGKSVPLPVLVEFWAFHETNAKRNRSMAAELVCILQLLERNGIAAIPYKGPTLAVHLYGDVAMREFGDLDILVNVRDAIAAKNLLATIGYHLHDTLEPEHAAAFLEAKRQYDFELRNEHKHILVELHWRTDSMFTVVSTNDQSWWDRLDTIQLANTPVLSIPPHELLLILCVHGIKHHWSRLGWLVDIAELIRRNPQLDWPWVLFSAKSLACEKRLAVSLCMAKTLLNTPLPDEVERSILQIPKINNLSERMQGSLFDVEYVEPTVFHALRLDLQLFDTLRQKIRYCTTLILEPNMIDWPERARLGPFAFLYLPLRLLRLAIKHGLQRVNKS